MPQNTRYDLTIYVDGGSRGNPGQAAVGAVIILKGREISRISKPIGTATNNEAEYQALITALEEARHLGATSVHVKMDSELMIRQLLKKYNVKSQNLRPYYEKVVNLLREYRDVGLERIPREKNAVADSLVNDALDILAKSEKSKGKDGEEKT